MVVPLPRDMVTATLGDIVHGALPEDYLNGLSSQVRSREPAAAA